MNNHPYNHQHSIEDSQYLERQIGEDDEGPFSPPPQQFAQQYQFPQPYFAQSVPPQQIRSRLCSCLGNWGLLGLRQPGQFGRDFWFFPVEIRRNSVTGYIWLYGRRQRVRYGFSQIRNFICVG